MDALSYIEVSLTTLGWQINGNIVSLIYSLNLHYLAFSFLILKNWFETNKSQDAGYAAVTALKRNEVDVYSAIIICLLFWVPNSATSINPAEAKYYNFNTSQADLGTNITEKIKSKATSIGADVTSDSAIPTPPALWAFNKLSKAFTYQLISWTDIDTDYSELLSTFSSLKIRNKITRSEVDDFYTTCYLPTLSKHQTSKYLPPSVRDADISWIGNNLFLNTPGYYGNCPNPNASANKCVLAFSYQMPYKISDRYGIPTGSDSQGNGIPRLSCKEWWMGVNPQTGGSDQDFGLRKKLLAEITWTETLTAALNDAELWSSSAMEKTSSMQDSLLKRLLRNDQPTLSYIPGWNEPEDVGSWYQTVADAAQSTIGAVGLGIDAGFASVFAETIRPALPMVQALFMMILIIASPIMLVLSSFSATFAFSIVYSMFVVTSLSFIWHLADLIDNKLMKAMYPDASLLTEFSLTGTTTDLTWVTVSSFTYIGLPLVWMGLLGKIGVDLTNSLNNGIHDAKGIGKSGAAKGLQS